MVGALVEEHRGDHQTQLRDGEAQGRHPERFV